MEPKVKSSGGRYAKQRGANREAATLTTMSPIIHPDVEDESGEREGGRERVLPRTLGAIWINLKGRVHSRSMLCVSPADGRNLWWYFIEIS